jgi:hypothetical protein
MSTLSQGEWLFTLSLCFQIFNQALFACSDPLTYTKIKDGALLFLLQTE